ncbi:hypothetical protein CPB86DRAFT_878792 [Serendipita vermifera]|nr:hypothetical protein CPB86DRAFT_878792 [Serendipita vermifera]
MATKCKWCNISFSNSSQLQEHLNLDIKQHLYYCQRCQHAFKTFRVLKEHFQHSTRHDADDNTELMTNSNSYCRHCRRQFDTPGQLNSHFSSAHNQNLQCETCELWFRRRNDLANHLRSPFHNAPIIPCPHCSETFKTTSGVAHHLEQKCLKKVTEAVVKWDVDHQITDAEYSNRIREVDSDDEGDDVLVIRNPGLFQVLEVLAATEEAWNGLAEAYVCPISDCGQYFCKLGHLNQHLRSQKHKANPSTFKCPKCSSRFPVVSALIQHLESEACGLAGQVTVKQIYTGLHDMFKRLLKF